MAAEHIRNPFVRYFDDDLFPIIQEDLRALTESRCRTYFSLINEMLTDVDQNADFAGFMGVFVGICHGYWLYFEYKVRLTVELSSLCTIHC